MLSLSFGSGLIGLSNNEIAVSGSFKPLPVNTDTTRFPLGNLPARCNLIKPAMEALLAGSLNIPSFEPSIGMLLKFLRLIHYQ